MLTLTQSLGLHRAPTPSLFKRARLAVLASRQRKQLAKLDADALQDIGITPEQAKAESQRLAWDVPKYWLC